MSHDCIVGQTRAGSWWTACTHPGCDHYQSGAPSRDAAEDRDLLGADCLACHRAGRNDM